MITYMYNAAVMEIHWHGKTRMHVTLAFLAAVIVTGVAAGVATPADHNDPIAINSIFHDVSVNPADLYDLFGFPSRSSGTETVVIALTFASVPATGVFDPDMLYVIKLDPDQRVEPPGERDRKSVV